LDNLFRDETTTPLVQERFAAFRSYLEAALNALMAGRTLRGTARRRTRAALGHAIAFSTWKSLVREQRLSKSDAATLVRALVAAASLLCRDQINSADGARRKRAWSPAPSCASRLRPRRKHSRSPC